MKKFRFNLLFVATVATLCSQSALAELNTYTHANGSTIVNINQADANGLSHNMYQNFNVTNKGLVLNNSTEDMVRASGDIARNSNLDKPASLILNEVISKNPSSLNGYIEVAGQKADVIIANPNGISCSGCSFVNTGRATLTTGTPMFTDGALTGFNVAKSAINVNGSGLKGADYTDLLAQKIAIQGQIDTTQLKAIAGTYTYDIAKGTATAVGARQLNSNSIDVSALGGATAGLIQLQTTEAGAGVNNNGVLNATTLSIASNGALTNSGTIQTSQINATAAGNVINNGTLNASLANLQAANAFTNNGTIATTDSATVVSLNKLTNNDRAQINAGGAVTLVSLAGNIENRGTLFTQKNLVMQTGYNSVNGVVTPVASTSLLNSGSIQAANLSMNAVNEINLLSGGNVTSQGIANVAAGKVSNAATLTAQNATIVANEVSNQGTLQATNQLNVTGTNGIVNAGTLQASTLTLSTDEKITNSSCVFWLFCTKGTLSADKITIAAPKMTKVSDLGGNVITHVLEMNNPVVPAVNTGL